MSCACLIMLFFCFTSCESVNQRLGLPNDNPAEQGLEYLIEKETGVKVDLTPSNDQKPAQLPPEISQKPDEILLD